MSSLVEGYKKYILKCTNNLIFSVHFLNGDSSFDIESNIKKYITQISYAYSSHDNAGKSVSDFVFRL